ncbi:MAG: hypothetical protein IK083_03425 [Abditibacteriota bacterium]|nr:hypothetical protein [Abditibacteriota bacterium]
MNRFSSFLLVCGVVCVAAAAGSAFCWVRFAPNGADRSGKPGGRVLVADSSARAHVDSAPIFMPMPGNDYTIPETKDSIKVLFQRENSELVYLDVDGDNSDKLWDMPDILFSKKLLPDLRLYSVNVYKNGNEVRNRITFAKLSDSESYKTHYDVTVNEHPKYVMYDIGDHFARLYREDPADFEKKFRLRETASPGAGLRLERWDIQRQSKKYIEDCERAVRERRTVLAPPLGFNTDLEVLKDSSGKVLWSSSETRFLKAEKKDNGYALISTAGVSFLSYNNGSPVYYTYEKSFYFFPPDPKSAPVAPVSAQLLSDNIVRIQYADGAEADWRLLLSYKDYINNKNKDRYPAASVVWYNGKKPIDTKYLAWDTDSDTSKKPVYRETLPAFVPFTAGPGRVPDPYDGKERRKSDSFVVKDCVKGRIDCFRHGNYDRWKEMPVFMQPDTRHLADTGVYTVSVYSFGGLTKNVCRFDKRSVYTVTPEDVIINPGRSSDLLDHFAYIYLESPQAFGKSFGLLSRRQAAEGLYLDTFSISGKKEEYLKARDAGLPEFWTRRDYTDTLAALRDAGGKTLWASSVAKVLDVRTAEKRGSGCKYVVLTDCGAVYIFVDDKGAVMADEYLRSFAADGILEEGQQVPALKSGRMLDDFQAEITYDNGLVVRYMVRLHSRDLKANLTRAKAPGASVLWSNGKNRIRENAMGWAGLEEGFLNTDP